jgi:predicted ester cyclase
MTTAEKLALEVLDALNAGEMDRVGAVVHEDFVDHGAPPWAPQGRAGYMTILGYVHDALKIRYEIHDVIASGSRVAIRATAHGKHDADFNGFAPTGRTYAMPTMHLYVERDGLLAEHWGIRDEIGVLMQVGALARPEPVGFGAPDA